MRSIILSIAKTLSLCGRGVGPLLPWLVLAALAANTLTPEKAMAQGFGQNHGFVPPPASQPMVFVPPPVASHSPLVHVQHSAPVHFPPPATPYQSPSYLAAQRDMQIRSQMESMRFHQHARQAASDSMAAHRTAELRHAALAEQARRNHERFASGVQPIVTKSEPRLAVPSNSNEAARVSAAELELGRQAELVGNYNAATRHFRNASAASPSRDALKAEVRLQRLQSRLNGGGR